MVWLIAFKISFMSSLSRYHYLHNISSDSGIFSYIVVFVFRISCRPIMSIQSVKNGIQKDLSSDFFKY